MSKRVFVSYSHKRGQWVWERLVPILRAAGCEVLFDRALAADPDVAQTSKFAVSRVSKPADAAGVLALCRFGNRRYGRFGNLRYATFTRLQHDRSGIRVKRADCDLSAFQRANDPPLWVDLTNDTDPAPWTLLLKSLDATRMNTAAPHWLDVRDEILRKLRDQQQSVNLVVQGLPNWPALRDHLKEERLPQFAIVNLDDPAMAGLPGLVGDIPYLRLCAKPMPVAPKAAPTRSFGRTCSVDHLFRGQALRSSSRRILRTTFRLRDLACSCSQILNTRQPTPRSLRVTNLSRNLFAASFFHQNEALLRGFVACSGQPCQKQPSTNTASRSLGKTKSGRTLRLRPSDFALRTSFCLRRPVMPCRRKKAASASSVSLLPRPRMRDITCERLALMKTSGMTIFSRSASNGDRVGGWRVRKSVTGARSHFKLHVMNSEDAFQEAERRIAEARQTRATKLRLYDLGLTELPPSVWQLTQLQELSVYNNQLTALPETLGQLTKLERLDVSHNRLAALPQALGQLTQLQHLGVSNNHLTALPEALGKLTQHERLDVSHNRLAALPQALGQLTQLQYLEVSNNQLTALPEALGKLTRLWEIRVSNNQLTTLPKTLGGLTRLAILKISSNKLTALPEVLWRVTKLQHLDVSHNQLTALPEALGQLTELAILEVSHNQLTALPQALGQLTELQVLDVEDNQLVALPQALERLTQVGWPWGLKTLLLQGNPALGIPPEVLGPTRQEAAKSEKSRADARAILDFYFGQRRR